MKQYITLSREMESGDHRLPSVAIEKNGASPKSLMSRGNLLKKFFLTFLATSIFAIGYSQNGEVDLETNTFDGTITADVVNGNDYNTIISKVEVVSGHAEIDPIAEGDYQDGGFTLTLPSTFDDQYLMDITELFFDENPENFVISDESARTLPLFDENFKAYNEDGELVGNFIYVNEDDDGALTYAAFFYVDRDVDITGTVDFDPDIYTFSMSLKEGWNIVYITQYDENTFEITSKEVEGMKWIFATDEEEEEEEEDIFEYTEDYDGTFIGNMSLTLNDFPLPDMLNLNVSDVTLEISKGTLVFPEIPILKIGDPVALAFEDVVFNQDGKIKAPEQLVTDLPIPLTFSIIESSSYVIGDDNEFVTLNIRMVNPEMFVDVDINFNGTKQDPSNNYTILEADKKIIGYYSILGQKLDREPESGLYIIIYDNFTSKKVMKLRK